MTASAPASSRPALLSFLLGWGAGALLFVLVRGAGLALLSGPCQGRAVLALLPPLLLGPGGLALAASNWGRPRRAMLGLGLAAASFLPALAVGARDFSVLRSSGCAGGYVVVAGAAGRALTEVSLAPGQTLDLTVRVGGYTPQSHPGSFSLSTVSRVPGLRLTLARPQARAGEVVPLRLSAAASAPGGTYPVGVRAVQRRANRVAEAEGTFDVNVLP